MSKFNYKGMDGVWRTISGRRVFIRTGQSLSDAMKESGKFKMAKRKKENIEASENKVDDNNYHLRTDLRKKDYENDLEFFEKNAKDLKNNEDYKATLSDYEGEFGTKRGNMVGEKELSLNEKRKYLKERGIDELNNFTKDDDDTFIKKQYEKEINNSNYYSNLREYEVYEKAQDLRNRTSNNELKNEIDKKLISIDRANKKGSGFAEKPTNDLRDILNRGENEELKEKVLQDQRKGIDDLYNLAQSKYTADTHPSYLEHNKIREEYLKNYDEFKNPVRPEKIKADDMLWDIGHKESMREQMEWYINNPGDSGDYNTMKAQDTLAIVKKEAPYSLHNKYLDAYGSLREADDRRRYGNAKIDSAIMRENEFLREGYTNINTDLRPNGMVNTFDYKDMIIKGEKDGIEVSFNYNEKGDSVMSLRQHQKNGGYHDVIYDDETIAKVSRIISRGGVGSPFRESMPYSKYEYDKLTFPEVKEYYAKTKAYYEKNKDAHFYDNKFFNKYNEKVRKNIISKRDSGIDESLKQRYQGTYEYLQKTTNMSPSEILEYLKKISK